MISIYGHFGLRKRIKQKRIAGIVLNPATFNAYPSETDKFRKTILENGEPKKHSENRSGKPKDYRCQLPSDKTDQKIYIKILNEL